jgi:dTDP-4-amino-4,6-dideoxygalactose transaminase
MPTRKEFLPFCLPTIGPKEKEEILSVLDSGWLTAGSVTKRFEKALAAYVGEEHAVALSSCTAALHLSLLALGVGPRDEVIVPSLTFCSTVNVIVHCGAIPVFTDVDPLTLTIDPDDFKRKMTERTKAVIPVHYAGYPCDMEPILSAARERSVFVVEDAAHALGAAYGGTAIGAVGDATCFSFYPTKTITTGEGGAVTTGDAELAEKVRLLSLHGMTRDAWERYTSAGSWQYQVTVPGFKYNSTDLEAALGVRQLERIDEFLDARRALWEAYETELSDVEELILPPLPPDGRHARHLFPVLLAEDCPVSRDRLHELLRDENIGTSVHFFPVHLQPYYRRAYPRVSLPVTESACERVLSLPLYPRMTLPDVADVARALKIHLRG